MNALTWIARRWRAGVSVVASFLAAGSAFAQAQPSGADAARTAELSRTLATLSRDVVPRLPDAKDFARGPRTVAVGATETGPVVTDGAVHVYGSVNGDVYSYDGDIVVHDKGSIAGDAVAINGDVRLEGGSVGGQILHLRAHVEAAPVLSPSDRMLEQLAVVGGWLVVLLALGVGVITVAGENLASVADALERHYGTTLVAGLAGQVAFAPLLAALLIALCLSILGILLVPFAAVAYVIVAAGLVALGILATAVVIGRGWRPAPAGTDRAQRGATMRALIVGVVILLTPWAIAALLTAWPLAEWFARGAALVITWVAATAGLGATLISRAGIKRAASPVADRAMASPSWQTPTPVSGVVAARRPAATPTGTPK